MVLGGLHADVENLRDFLGGLAFDDEVKGLALARRQRVVRIEPDFARTLVLVGERLGRARPK